MPSSPDLSPDRPLSIEPVDPLFSRWTELTDLYASQLVLWEHGDLSAFHTALELAPEIEQLRRLISGEPADQRTSSPND